MEKQKFKLTDDVIVIVRELVQLAIITGTSLVDHMRAVQLVEDPNRPGYMQLDADYVASYNEYISALNAEAQKRAAEAQATEAKVDG